MKTLQEQYNKIKEGKGSKQIFLTEAKKQFSDMLTNPMGFDEASKILKTRGVISENYIDLQPINTMEATPKTSYEVKFAEFLAEEAKAVEKKTTKEVDEINAHSFDYKDKSNLDNQIGQEVLNGIYFEAKQNPDKDLEEIRKMVSKNLEKDGQYYMKNAAFGVEGLGYQEQKQEEVSGAHKASGYSDKLKEMVKEALTEGKKSKKDSVESKLAEIDKQGQVVALEAKMDTIDEMIEAKTQRLSMVSEDENLAELVDKKAIKGMQKEIKLLEKRKAKMEKMYEKMCGKSYTKTEVVDETVEMFESVDLKDLMKDGKINNDILVTTKPGASKDEQMKNSLRPKSIEDNSENAGPGAKLVRFADLAGGSDKDYKVENGKIVDVSLIEDK